MAGCGSPGRGVRAAVPEHVSSDPQLLPGLAGALSNLGVRYVEVGRRDDAVAVTEEAVQLRRQLVASDPELAADLAAGLDNLGSDYAKVGRRDEAVTVTEEAVRLYRGAGQKKPGAGSGPGNSAEQPRQPVPGGGPLARGGGPGRAVRAAAPEAAAANPAFAPGLAKALDNLAGHYSEVGRLQDAVARTEEAVQSGTSGWPRKPGLRAGAGQGPGQPRRPLQKRRAGRGGRSRPGGPLACTGSSPRATRPS